MNRLGGVALAVAVAAAAVGVLVACKSGLADDARPAPSAGAPRAVAPPAPPGELTAVAPATLCLTRGARTFADGRLQIDEPTVRAVALTSHGDAAALRFVYGGDTAAQVALASGQVRRQLGLKLRAANGCNLVYVMWRLDPTPMIEVSTKVNPGDADHGDCGTKGYAKLKPQRSEPPPALVPGEGHTLSAEIRGDVLLALVDDRVVWRGPLDERARGLRGPVGLRTDNVRLDAELLVAPADPATPRPHVPGCE